MIYCDKVIITYVYLRLNEKTQEGYDDWRG